MIVSVRTVLIVYLRILILWNVMIVVYHIHLTHSLAFHVIRTFTE